jgi:hypothetical protein
MMRIWLLVRNRTEDGGKTKAEVVRVREGQR